MKNDFALVVLAVYVIFKIWWEKILRGIGFRVAMMWMSGRVASLSGGLSDKE